jgi:cytochrome c2
MIARLLLGVGIALLLVRTARAQDAPPVYDKKCKVCHSVAGVAGAMAKTGGPLEGVGAKRDEAWLRSYLQDPKSKIPNSKMPKLSLSEEDLSALIGYLLALKSAPPAP